jgi:XTP/dITP diphosphohydrolase
LADDSGIEVDYLKGAPGIYSARFAGENATDEENNSELLKLLENVSFERRTARYRCVMAVATPLGIVQTAEGTCEGKIASASEGKNGFGYDPLFFYPPFGQTFGQTDPNEKNKVSHRYHALQKIRPILIKVLSYES